MKQLGKNTPRAKKPTANDYSIVYVKKFIKQLAGNNFFSGPEETLTPKLKTTLAQEFEKFLSRNLRLTEHRSTAESVIEHAMPFLEETFRLKRISGKKQSWADILILLSNHQWRAL